VAKLIGVVRRPTPPRDPVVIGQAGLQRVTWYLPIDGEPGADPEVTAVWCGWVEGDVGPDTVVGVDHAWLVDERPQWDGGPLPGAVTRFSFLLAAAGVTRVRFGEHWSRQHAPLARRHHPALWRYVQNVVVRPLTPTTPEVDGIAELTFATVEDLRQRMYDSDEGRRVIGDDVRRFIEVRAGWRVLTTASGTEPRPGG
jgi:uncharacterized protein (TIGR02118 family)